MPEEGIVALVIRNRLPCAWDRLARGRLTQGQEPVRHGGQRHILRIVYDFPHVARAALVQGGRGNDVAPIAANVESRA